MLHKRLKIRAHISYYTLFNCVFPEVVVPLDVTFDEAVSSCWRLGGGRLPRFDSLSEWRELLARESGRIESTHLWFPFYKVGNRRFVLSQDMKSR